MHWVRDPVNNTVLESKLGSQVSNGQINGSSVNSGMVKRVAMQLLTPRNNPKGKPMLVHTSNHKDLTSKLDLIVLGHPLVHFKMVLS